MLLAPLCAADHQKVMGEVIFSKSFRMLEDHEWHIAAVMLRRAMVLMGPATPVPWLAHIGFKFFYAFGVVRDWFAMQAFCHQRIYERINVRRYSSDLLVQHLLTLTR